MSAILNVSHDGFFAISFLAKNSMHTIGKVLQYLCCMLLQNRFEINSVSVQLLIFAILAAILYNNGCSRRKTVVIFELGMLELP